MLLFLQNIKPWKITCLIWRNMANGNCQNVSLSILLTILTFPLPGYFSKAESSFRANESVVLVFCLRNNKITFWNGKNLGCWYIYIYIYIYIYVYIHTYSQIMQVKSDCSLAILQFAEFQLTVYLTRSSIRNVDESK